VVVVPDGALTKWENVPGDGVPDPYLRCRPDLAVDVRSPTDRRGDANTETRFLRTAGIALVWWVLPEDRAVEVDREGDPVVTLREGDVLDGGDVLPGFTVPVAAMVRQFRRRG
jgi:Uma2 family endonuclease